MAGRVTTKGQVTIPLEIRDQLGIQPGSVVDFEVREDTVVIRKQRDGSGRGAALVQRLRGAATSGLSTDSIMRLTRE